MKKLLIACIVSVVVTCLASSSVLAGSLEQRINLLEKRIAALEKIVTEKEKDDSSSEPDNDDGILVSGICIVGEDIEPGSYSADVVSGGIGLLCIFIDYNAFVKHNGNQFSSIFYQDLRNPSYVKNSGSDEFDNYINSYLTRIENLNLKNDMCISVNGVAVRLKDNNAKPTKPKVRIRK